ncbi:MAG: ABC transporter permease, partial [bacterium]|nr:ABC transporter permease [bacterium]
MDDLRSALRTLSQKPGLACIVVVILALGIGATTTIFSIVNSVLLSSLPYRDGDRLVTVRTVVETDGTPQSSSYQDILSWSEQSRFLEDVSAFDGLDLNMTGGTEAERVRVNFVSASYFDLLGIHPFLGRNFLPADENSQDPPTMAILSYRLWRDRFGSDPDIIDQGLSLHDRSFTIVGVLPEDFVDISEGDLYVPVTVAKLTARPGFIDDRRVRWLMSYAKLGPGVSLEQAQEEAKAIAARLAETYPTTNESMGISVRPMLAAEFNFDRMRLAIIIILVGAAFVLLIGCANVTNLLLLRMVERRKEIALRLAMGADHRRLARQSVLENLLLSLLGGGLGIIVSLFSVELIVNLTRNSNYLPEFITIGVDLRAFGAAVALSFVVGLIVSVIPVRKGLKVNLQEELQQEGKGQTGSGKSLALRFLTISAVFFSVVLLVEAGLMLRSLRELMANDPGFQVKNVLTGRFELTSTRYPEEQDSFNVYRRLIDEARSLPGVEDAGIWGPSVLGYSFYYKMLTREGLPLDNPEHMVRACEHRISPGILTSMGITLLRGRDFTEQDDVNHPTVGIVSQSLAEAVWPEGDPLGKRFWTGPPQNLWVEVVGVARDVRQRGRLFVGHDFTRDVYFPILQIRARNSAIIMRTSGDPMRLKPAAARLMDAIDPDVPIFNILTFEERMREEEAWGGAHLNSALLGIFAAAALFLAITGLYTVLSYAVHQRHHEIGVRLSIGASKAEIFRQFMREGMFLLLIGLVAGIVAALVLSKV